MNSSFPYGNSPILVLSGVDLLWFVVKKYPVVTGFTYWPEDHVTPLVHVINLRRCELPAVHCKTSSSGVCVFTTLCSRWSWPLERDDDERGRWLLRESCASSVESDSYRCHVVIPLSRVLVATRVTGCPGHDPLHLASPPPLLGWSTGKHDLSVPCQGRTCAPWYADVGNPWLL